MAYVPVPKDLTAVKSKVFLNLTRRQLICFGGGALIGVPAQAAYQHQRSCTLHDLCHAALFSACHV